MIKFLLLLVLAATLSANTINIFSGDGINEFNSSSGNNVLITPHPAWATPYAGSAWISSGDTGFNGTVIPNSVLPWVSFFETFYVPSDAFGTISVYADDTAAVWLDGVLLTPASFTPAAACATPHGCVPSTGWTINFGAESGNHVLQFGLFQLAGATTGLDYAGTVSYRGDIAPTPEPGSMGACALAIAGLIYFARKRSATV